MSLSITSRKLVYFIIYYNLFCGFAIKNLGLDKSFLFLIDILYIIIFLRGHFKINRTGLKLAVIILCLLFFVLLIGAIGNDVAPFNFIWGLRNQYFSLAIFFASTSFLSIYDINKIFKFFFYFQFLNIACALYQYFVLGYYADANNGAFTSGGGQDIFCGVLIAYYLYEYTQHRCKAWHFIFVLVSSLAIAALEEEKFIFIEIVFIFAYFYLTSKKLGFKKIALAIIFIAVFGIGLSFLSQIGGTGSLEILTNKDAFMEYQENAYALPRVGSSAIIEKMFFTDYFQYYFELGYKWNIADAKFAVKGNATYLKNELKNLGNDTGYMDLDGIQGFSGGGTRGSNGQPFPYFYGYKTDGVFQNMDEVRAYVNKDGKMIMPDAVPGDTRFVDVNGDGSISADDRTNIGNGTPDWTYGLNLNADWKGFDFNIFFQGVAGADVFDGTYRTDVASGNYPSWMLGRWTGEGT